MSDSLTEKLSIDFNVSKGGTSLVKVPPNFIAYHSDKHKLMAIRKRPPKVNGAPAGEYIKYCSFKWDTNWKKPIHKYRFNYHVTINPALDCEWQDHDNPSKAYGPEALQNKFEEVLKELERSTLYTQIIGVCEYFKEEVKTMYIACRKQTITIPMTQDRACKAHIHFLIQTKNIKIITGILKNHFSGIKRSPVAVVVNPININHIPYDVKKKMTPKEIRAAMHDSVAYIQDVYFRKSKPNDEICWLYKRHKHLR